MVEIEYELEKIFEEEIELSNLSDINETAIWLLLDHPVIPALRHHLVYYFERLNKSEEDLNKFIVEQEMYCNRIIREIAIKHGIEPTSKDIALALRIIQKIALD